MARKREMKGLSLFFFLFTVSQYIGWRLQRDGNIRWTWQGVLGLLLGGLLAAVAVSRGVMWLEDLIRRRVAGHIAGRNRVQTVGADVEQAARKGVQQTSSREKAQARGKWGPPRYFAASFCTMLLCWLWGAMAYYPGICSYDVTIQAGQVVSGSYGTHHPLAHTLLVGLFMRLGSALGSVNMGIALYTVFQMICLAAAFAAGIAWLRAVGVGKVWLVLTWIWSCLYPFHLYMSITVTKDVFFTVFFVLQLLCLCQILRRGAESRALSRWDIFYLLSTVGMVLFRNNGRYALLPVLFFLAVGCIRKSADRRLLLRLLAGTMAGLLLGSAGLSLLQRATDAQQGDKREMLSIPIQQLARTMIYHGGVGVLEEDDATMEEEDIRLVNDFILDEAYREYRPDIADPVKRHTYTHVVRYRTGEFLRTYLRLFARYPGDYVNAAFAVNMGYYYLWDTSHAHINENGVEQGLGYIQTRQVEHELKEYGIYRESRMPGLLSVMERYADGNLYLCVPVLRLLMIPGVWLWIWLFAAVCLWIRKKYLLLLPISLVAGYYLTLVLGPAVQLRYLYPVMAAAPFVLGYVKAELCRRPKPGKETALFTRTTGQSPSGVKTEK